MLAWEYSLENSSYRLMYECKGHKGPVESVAVDANNNYVSHLIIKQRDYSHIRTIVGKCFSRWIGSSMDHIRTY